MAEMTHIMEMPVEQKILLLEDVWDSILSDSNRVPVPKSHRKELDRRLKKYEHNASALLNDQQLRDAVDTRK
jgi:putative addiction module component (TIGR02574 family)